MSCELPYDEYLLKRSYFNDPFKNAKFVTNCNAVRAILGLPPAPSNDMCIIDTYENFCKNHQPVIDAINKIQSNESAQRAKNKNTDGVKEKIVKDFDPSLFQMAKNFGTAMLDSAKTGFKKVTPEQHAERMAICNTCQFWDGKARMGMGKCAKCGCTGAKQWLSSSSCPINLWGSLP